MAKVISVVNQKGGVGKTATALNLAASFALEGKQTLVVDLDGLCSLTKALGYDPTNFDCSVASIIEKPNMVAQSIYGTDIENLSLMPSSPLLDTLELSILNRKDRYDLLKKGLERVKPAFEYIVVDCAPALNTMFVNALTASDFVVVPAETKFQSNLAFEVFLSTFQTFREMKNPHVKILGVIPTMYNCQANEDKTVLQELQEKTNVLGVIKRTTAVSSSVAKGMPCVIANRRTVVAKEYREITKKILNMMEVLDNVG